MKYFRLARSSLFFRLTFIFLILCEVQFFFGNSDSPSSLSRASAQAVAKATVIEAIAIVKTADLDFGTISQGSSEATLDPTVLNNLNAASFQIVGQPGRSYTINLPADGTVELTTGTNLDSSHKIRIYGFSSFPPPSSGVLNGIGQQKISVGATRAPVPMNQSAGSYTGTFTVTVIY